MLAQYPSNWPPIKNAQHCLECNGIVIPQNSEGHLAFHIGNYERGKVMSNVLWCDPGNHVFKKGEPGSQSFNGTFVDDDGITQAQIMDVCSQHAFKSAQREIA
jgi:hypothetical protein